jgi:hypothetical protein
VVVEAVDLGGEPGQRRGRFAVPRLVDLHSSSPPGAEPQVITGIVARYRGAADWTDAPNRSVPPRLGEMIWLSSAAGRPGGLPVAADRYVAADGATVLVVHSPGRFPEAAGARPVAGGDWVAEVDGVTVFCTQQPDVALVVGADRVTVFRAAAVITRQAAE